MGMMKSIFPPHIIHGFQRDKMPDELISQLNFKNRAERRAAERYKKREEKKRNKKK